jgi:hypothetical protein
MVAFARVASATPVAIVNPSFEAVTVDANTAPCLSGSQLVAGDRLDDTTTGIAGTCTDATPLPGWSVAGGAAGVWSPPTGTYSNQSGLNVAYSAGGTLTQNLNAVLRPGTYSLQVWVGMGNGQAGQLLTITLSAGGTVVASWTGRDPPPSRLFAEAFTQTTIAPNSPLLGMPLSISITTPGPSEWDFDSVALDGPPPPSAPAAPAAAAAVLALALLLAGARGLGGSRPSSAVSSSRAPSPHTASSFIDPM